MIFNKDIQEKIKNYIKTEWLLKGHNLTGAFIDSISFETNEDGTEIKVLANEYGLRLNNGVKASSIPYSGRSGSGGKSKYITGLKNYVKERMGISDEREALGIAFAIATKHSREGIKGSGFLDDALLKLEKDLDKDIINNLNKNINKWL